MVSIKREDGTEYALTFYTEDTRDGGQKDERWKFEKLKDTELYTTAKYRGMYNLSPYISTLNKTHDI